MLVAPDGSLLVSGDDAGAIAGAVEAHAVVGALVRRSLDDGVPLVDLVAEEPRLGEAGVALLAPGVAVRQRTTPGSGGPGPVTIQRQRLAEAVAERRLRWAV